MINNNTCDAFGKTIISRTFLLSAIIVVTNCMGTAGQDTKPPVKFKDFVFDSVQVQKDLFYYLPPPGIKKKYYCFDLYEPAGDVSPERPLIIWLHGGGFKFGTKKTGGVPAWSRTFAQRGYVCAAINYRLSKKHPLKHVADLMEGCADAVEDVNRAVQFFKQRYQQYRIDSNRIILGGHSAGGMIALQAVYSSPSQINAAAVQHGDTTTRPVINNPEHIAAIINYWGAVFNLKWLQQANVPIVSVHGRKDGIVPIDSRKQPLNGSLTIHKVADSLRIPNSLKIFEGYSHELQKHFNPIFAGKGTRKRWLQAGQFCADFLYAQLW